MEGVYCNESWNQHCMSPIFQYKHCLSSKGLQNAPLSRKLCLNHTDTLYSENFLTVSSFMHDSFWFFSLLTRQTHPIHRHSSIYLGCGSNLIFRSFMFIFTSRSILITIRTFLTHALPVSLILHMFVGSCEKSGWYFAAILIDTILAPKEVATKLFRM